MHLGGLFYPLPKSIQPLEFISPAFYLNKLNLYVAGAQSMDALSFGTGPSSHATPVLCIPVLVIVTLFFWNVCQPPPEATRIRRRHEPDTGNAWCARNEKLYPNLCQYAAIRAQTVLREPGGVFSSQQFRSAPERNHRP